MLSWMWQYEKANGLSDMSKVLFYFAFTYLKISVPLPVRAVGSLLVAFPLLQSSSTSLHLSL